MIVTILYKLISCENSFTNLVVDLACLVKCEHYPDTLTINSITNFIIRGLSE